MPQEESYDSIHRRLLASDPTAPPQLVQKILDPLIKRLAHKYPYISDLELITDAVTDALINYIKNPGQFDSSRRGLFGYLQMAAEGDLKNALAKARRILEREISTEDVELVASDGNIDVSSGPDDQYERSEMRAKLRSLLIGVFRDPVDLRAAQLILEGERSTEKFAELFGLQHLTTSEKRREVKRQKDRVKKCIERRLKVRHEE